MKALKDETDGLYAVIKKFEDQTKESNALADQADCDIRDYGKKVHGFEIEFDETTDKLFQATGFKQGYDKVQTGYEREVELPIYKKNLQEARTLNVIGTPPLAPLCCSTSHGWT